MNKIVAVTAVVCCSLLAACASDKSRESSRRSGGTYGTDSTSTYDSGATGTPRATPGGGTAAGDGAMPDARVVYFDFDSAQLKPESMALIDAWAQHLSANSGSKVRLEGHADERGTREYNVGLGERRSLAVREALTARGVSVRQLGVASFGEERPVALGHDESAWGQNRRVEIVQ